MYNTKLQINSLLLQYREEQHVKEGRTEVQGSVTVWLLESSLYSLCVSPLQYVY